MNIRRFKALHEAGATYADIARECGCDWRTVRRYLADDAPTHPPQGTSRAGTQPRAITDDIAALIEEMLRADITIAASVIHERLTNEKSVTVNYQRVKIYCSTARPIIRDELGAEESGLGNLHRRFETIPGAQAQVDWGDEGDLFGTGRKVYSFHMVLSFSRDPFCCYTHSMDAAAFWGSHIRAFAHFGGVPGSIVYNRTKTIVRKHVRPGHAVPLHPAAVAFSGHYGFDIDVLAAYRPTGKGRVERQVKIVRDHVLAGRTFTDLASTDRTFMDWVPIRRTQVHRTHREVIGTRAVVDHAALRPAPAEPYLVAEAHLRRIGNDALISFEASLYSVPADRVRAGQRVQVRAGADNIAIATLDSAGGTVLAVHARSQVRGAWVVDQAHWASLPDGHTRATTDGRVDTNPAEGTPSPSVDAGDPLTAKVISLVGHVHVEHRPLSAYAV
ncbi:IS21 family transposase [Rhodococcoides fascians]|uniref:IS21 family transposase n=1 Tax=Rhodococcoides fascians TaxID=1828 RepID=UPI00367153E0